MADDARNLKAGPEYFREFYALRSSLTSALVAANVLYQLGMVALMAAMIRIERSAPGNRRTIIARLVSCLCRYNVAFTGLYMWPRYAMLLTGPWGGDVCHLLLVVHHVLLSCLLNSVVLISMIKSLFIYVFKNVWILQDDFVLAFVRVLLPLLGALFCIPMLTLPGTYPKHLLVCVGYDADEPFSHYTYSPRNSFSKLGTETVAVVIYVVCTASVFFARMWDKFRKSSPGGGVVALANMSTNGAENNGDVDENGNIVAGAAGPGGLDNGATAWRGLISRLRKRIVNLILLAALVASLKASGLVYKARLSQISPEFLAVYLTTQPNFMFSSVIFLYLHNNQRMREDLSKEFSKARESFVAVVSACFCRRINLVTPMVV